MSKLLFVLMGLTVLLGSFSAMANEEDSYGYAYEYDTEDTAEQDGEYVSPHAIRRAQKYSVGFCASGPIPPTSYCKKDYAYPSGRWTKGQSCPGGIGMYSDYIQIVSGSTAGLANCPSTAGWSYAFSGVSEDEE